MATAATAVALTAGAATAQAAPIPGFPTLPSIPTPTGVNIPNYGNIPGQFSFFPPQPNSSTGCPTAGCYVPFATTFFPVVGNKVLVNGVSTTVPSTPTNDIPVVSTSSGTSILLPTFLF
jgi:hypothetical protein